MAENIKKKLQALIAANQAKEKFTDRAGKAMTKADYNGVSVFDFFNEKTMQPQLVMINMIGSEKELESGCITNEKGKIVGFKNSNDKKTVSVDENARFLIFDSIKSEPDLLELKALAKNECSWIIHRVKDDKHFDPAFCNIHSHGMQKIFTHKDFQVVLDMGDEIACYLINTLCERVRDGNGDTVFTPGQIIDGIYSKFPIKLASATEAGRPVLRILIPDDNGLFPGDDGCAAPYCDQLVKFRG